MVIHHRKTEGKKGFVLVGRRGEGDIVLGSYVNFIIDLEENVELPSVESLF